MSGMQKKIHQLLIEALSVYQGVKTAEVVDQTQYANNGTVYVLDGLTTLMEVGYDYQREGFHLEVSGPALDNSGPASPSPTDNEGLGEGRPSLYVLSRINTANRKLTCGPNYNDGFRIQKVLDHLAGLVRQELAR